MQSRPTHRRCARRAHGADAGAPSAARADAQSVSPRPGRCEGIVRRWARALTDEEAGRLFEQLAAQDLALAQAMPGVLGGSDRAGTMALLLLGACAERMRLSVGELAMLLGDAESELLECLCTLAQRRRLPRTPPSANAARP